MESYKSPEQPVPAFEEVFAELNLDLGYEYSELSGHDPSDGIWRFQLKEPLLNSSVPGNKIALDHIKNEAYVQLLRAALSEKSDEEFNISILDQPSLHIVVEKIE